MNGKLLSDNVLVLVEEPKEQKVGSIIIPDTAKEKPQEGKIVLVGPGKTNNEGKIIPMSVKVGDVVLFEKYAGREVKIDDQKYIIISQDNILFVK
ncbi:MAG: co-chaperone GroES [Elusimicrobiota bacterium]|jgi:chaperonin GroES|nr:co-chaperone GroES [Elusimicrobiota bacterium]